MKDKAIFYHAGCPVCVEAEQSLADALDKSRYELEVVHLGKEKSRVEEAMKKGIKSVPALLIGGKPYHINFGANLNDLK
ncbi:MAG: thioredoxin family protein [Deltaproteobacteria bacterium]|nr:thioredoxin family protein [Deltaproteobacteria bacterium]